MIGAASAIASQGDVDVAASFSQYEAAFAWDEPLNSPQAAAIDQTVVGTAYCPVASGSTAMCDWCAFL